MLEDGYSLRYIHDHFGIDITLLSMLWEGYQKYGPPFLEKKKMTKATTEIKLKAIRDFEEKHLSLAEVMSRYDISRSALCHWRKLYHEGGIAELSRIKHKGRPPGMGRPKQIKTLSYIFNSFDHTFAKNTPKRSRSSLRL